MAIKREYVGNKVENYTALILKRIAGENVLIRLMSWKQQVMFIDLK